MKNQYFGDVNDYRKYGLLRHLTRPNQFRLGVCWMMTEPDERTDGDFRAYLNGERFRECDAELFDWLKATVRERADRQTRHIEAATLLPGALYHSVLLCDHAGQRAQYFADCRASFAGCDLVFFDPDNGMEIDSLKKGRKDSSKFLYWDELREVYESSSSVIVYQHFRREARSQFVDRMAVTLFGETKAAAVFSFRTPHVVFLLAAHDRHATAIHGQLDAVRKQWPVHKRRACAQIEPRLHAFK